MKDVFWPVSRLGEVLRAFAAVNGLASPPTGSGLQPPESFSPEWLETAAQSLGLEAQAVEIPYADLDRGLGALGPALLRVPTENGPCFLALLPGKRLHVLAPDLGKRRLSPSALRSALTARMETPLLAEIGQLLDRAEVASSDRAAALQAILRQRLSERRIGGIWLLRLPPSAGFRLQLKQARVFRRLLALAAAHSIQYILWILAWWVVGSNVINRRADSGWLVLWALLLLTLIPFRVLITWLQGLVAIGAGARLKQRLFFGSLRLTPDSIRHQGAGQLLGRVLESEAVEALALSGGFLALVAVIELVISLFVLGAGAGGLLQSGLLLAWLIVTGGIAWVYFQRNRSWTEVRLRMTHALVESMVGHRTRLAQLPPDRWHEGEDEALESYLKSSKAMDRSTMGLLAIAPRGWLVVGLLGLAPAFVAGGASTARMAIAAGGMLLAYRALRRFAAGAWQLAGAAVAWERVAVLYRAAKHPEAIGSPDVAASESGPGVLDARDLVFRYSSHAEPVLRGCELHIRPGDRWLLDGPSGGGKSTLVSLLIGLREPNSGQLLVDGRERATLGAEAWRKRIAAAPQFHENHVLAETFAFNLLMGRRGTPGPGDLPEAEAICRELGLGDLLDRMPAGLLQMVGETGWQLSHGERSRLYIARTLLQDADVIVLDESFAALDPENLQSVLKSVARRARALLVISHR
jgi:ATP-binding cassette subfamily B protein